MSEYTQSDVDALRDAHQLVWESSETSETTPVDWKTRLAQQYSEQLFKEFALIDLQALTSTNRIGIRWRTKAEVVSEKGNRVCGSLSCNQSQDLNTLEVPFQYEEKGVVKVELVKVKLCSSCALLILRSNN